MGMYSAAFWVVITLAHAHTQPHRRTCRGHIPTRGPRGTVGQAPEGTDSVSDMLSRWEVLAFSENRSNLCSLETGKF